MLSKILSDKQSQLTQHFKPGFLQRENTVFQFHFETDEDFYLIVKSTAFQFVAGKHDTPTLSLNILDHATCWGLLEGEIDGMQAFMAGNYRADGNIVLSQLLLYLFKSNDSTISYEVQD